MWFLLGGVSSSTWCLGWAALFYFDTLWAFHINIFQLKIVIFYIHKTRSQYIRICIRVYVIKISRQTDTGFERCNKYVLTFAKQSNFLRDFFSAMAGEDIKCVFVRIEIDQL